MTWITIPFYIEVSTLKKRTLTSTSQDWAVRPTSWFTACVAVVKRPTLRKNDESLRGWQASLLEIHACPKNDRSRGQREIWGQFKDCRFCYGSWTYQESLLDDIRSHFCDLITLKIEHVFQPLQCDGDDRFFFLVREGEQATKYGETKEAL